MKDALEAIVVAELDSIAFDLVELRREGARGRTLVEVRIDRRDGAKVTIDDCAGVSRMLEARLDGSGLVPENYVLQVSSPGERLLRTAEEWRRFVGHWVSVLSPSQGGRFEGKLAALEEEGDPGSEIVVLEVVGGGPRRIPLAAVKSARLTFRI